MVSCFISNLKILYNFPAGIWYLEAWGRVVPTPGGICPAHEQEPNPPYPLRELVEIKVLNTCHVYEGVYPAFCFWYRMCNYAEKKPFANSCGLLKPLILLGFYAFCTFTNCMMTQYINFYHRLASLLPSQVMPCLRLTYSRLHPSAA